MKLPFKEIKMPPDVDYGSMLEDLYALPKTRNPLKLVQRKMLEIDLLLRIQEQKKSEM